MQETPSLALTPKVNLDIERHHRRTPLRSSDPASDRYDSCVDDENKPKIFVIFDNDQFYPESLMKYLSLEREVAAATV